MLKLKTFTLCLSCEMKDENKINRDRIEEKISKYISKYISSKNYNISSEIRKCLSVVNQVDVYIDFKRKISLNTIIKILNDLCPKDNIIYYIHYNQNRYGKYEITVKSKLDILNT